MKRLVYLILILLLSDLLFQQCANPRSPTGGPKDSIPPVLIQAFPETGTTNFSDTEIRLEFSEYINADKLQQTLIITPQTDVKYKSIVKREELIIKFEEPFQDSTTYNLNFADAVVDITEKNPVVNLSLAFSTGSFIDSMSIAGNIIDLFEQVPATGYLVGIYPVSDSLDFFTHKPVYFTTTNDSGNFKLNYLKKGLYKVLAFNDDNNNILLDPETEEHGFLSSDIELDSPIVIPQPIPTVLQNIKPIEFINGRATGLYFELKYNKLISDYHIMPDSLYHNLVGDKDLIRIYKPDYLALEDSTQIIVNASDSLLSSTIDTVYIKYFESRRKPTDLSYSIKQTTSALTDDLELKINFNKPITNWDSTRFSFQKDSIFEYSVTPSFSWNFNQTSVKASFDINKDSILSELAKVLPRDTLEFDSISQSFVLSEPVFPKSLDLIIDSVAFISVENDSTQKKIHPVPLEESSSYGTIEFTLDTDYSYFNLQLLDSKDQVAYSNSNQKQFTFPRIKPGKYKIRVLIDNNEDGKWSAGNLFQNIEPEEVYLHPEETSVRENWVLELSISF